MPTPNTQDDAVEAAFLAGTLPEEDRRAEDRRAPDVEPVAEPVAEPDAELVAEAEPQSDPEPAAPSKPSESVTPASVMCGNDGLPLPA